MVCIVQRRFPSGVLKKRVALFYLCCCYCTPVCVIKTESESQDCVLCGKLPTFNTSSVPINMEHCEFAWGPGQGSPHSHNITAIEKCISASLTALILPWNLKSLTAQEILKRSCAKTHLLNNEWGDVYFLIQSQLSKLSSLHLLSNKFVGNPQKLFG